MSVADLVSNLKQLDIRLSTEGERLRVNAPKGVLTENLRAQIAERKEQLLEFLRDYGQPAALVPPPILRQTTGEPAPLSFAQERLWFLEQLEPETSVYNISRAFRLTGQLNVAALEASLTEVLRRHQVLRSQISIIGGRPMQIAAAAAEFKLHFTDLRSLIGTTLDDEIRRQIKAEVEQLFDFSAGLLLRGAILQTNNDQHILILTTHHIVADAWSMGILTQELWTLYDGYAKRRSSPLQQPPVQYSDYAVWQREWLQGEVLKSQLSYWRKQLENLPVLNLPTDRARPVKQSYRGTRQSIALPQSLTTAVNELSRREGVTQFMTLLAAFQVLLYRYSAQEDVVVGSPIGNRSGAQIEGLIGFFVNTLVLRSDLSGNPTFREFLLRVREVCLGAYVHQGLPFEKLVEELRPERDLSRNPLFQVMFVLQNTPRPFQQPAGLSSERIDVLPATSLFDLSLYLRERDGKLIGFVEYNTDLFESSIIERMIGHFETLLEGIVADPDQPISTLPILTEAERHQLLVEWNNTETEYPKDVCIHELFEAQAAKTPEAIALEFEGKQLTYGELNRRSNQLAHYLQGLGIGPEKLVGICIERSIEMVIGLLGILKAGGAYVPLDPAYPRERLEFMLKDAQFSVLITQEKLIEYRGWRSVLSETEGMDNGGPSSPVLGAQIKIVCLDTDWETFARQSEQKPHSQVKAHNLAYVIYTSGSTGTPKGVAIEHRNAVNLLQWAKTVYGPSELAGVLASTSICFDLSVFELFVPLSRGGKVILAENALHLHSIAAKNELTLINTVPSVMAELLAMGDLPASVQTANLAGEVLRSDLVKQIYESTSVQKVYDLYGPSEATIYSTFKLRTAEGPPTIGRPISNTRIYILDGNLQPVPLGILGELYIVGAGVARGYLRRPDLTAEKFISSFFNANDGERIYRTGDLARYRPDGDIEFLGRADRQVKIRGHRIELGEIEALLTKHPTVKDCVVEVCEHQSRTGKSLVGYVVPRQPSVLSVTELRRYLKEKLPEYMVPSAFVLLDTLPVSLNGKVDREQLPSPDYARPQLNEELVAPRSEIGELIAQTWREVLKVKNLGIHDSFFELGGHSLLAIQVVSRLREAFNREIPLRALFETPTIAGLTSCIEGLIRGGHALGLPPILPVPREKPLALSINQEHLWTLDQSVPGTHIFNMPYVYRLTGDLDVAALEKSLGESIRRHEVLRTVFATIDRRPIQIVRDGCDFHLPVEDLRAESSDNLSQKAAAMILEEREQPFELGGGPLFRTKLVRLTEKESFLLVTMHHIISDHWSMQVFRRELVSMYEAYSQGRYPRFGGPPIQFGDYVVWEKQLLENRLLDGQREYWRQQLAGPLSELRFHKNPTPKSELRFQTARRLIEIDDALLTRIKSLAAQEDCTLFVTILAALNLVLYALTGKEDIRIGTLLANRRRREAEGAIGHFLNTVVLRTRLSPELNYRQLLKKVREVTLEAYAHQELPFEQLCRVLEKEQKIKRGSLFQVLLSYQNPTFQSQELAAQELPGLTIAPLGWQLPPSDSEVMLTACDFIVNVRETSTKLAGSVNFRTESVDLNSAGFIVKGFATVLRRMVVDVEGLISMGLDEISKEITL